MPTAEAEVPGSDPDHAPVSPAAAEVLGALAPLAASGPHAPDRLRRHTRLTGAAFDAAVAELADRGLVQRRHGQLWTTPAGDRAAGALFP